MNDIDLNTRARQLREIAAVALRLPRAPRERYLDAVCRNSDERARIQRAMLDGEVGSFLEARHPAPPSVEGLELESELGSGRRGRVYVAFERAHRRWVVAQFLEVRHLPEALHLVRAELAGQRSLELPESSRLLDVRDCAGSQRLCLLSELVRGLRWDDYCKGLERRDRLRCLLRVARVLERAHAQHVFHRDLRSRNLRMRSNGVPSLLDFGVVRRLEQHGLLASETRPHVLRTISPEWRRHRQDSGPLADVYSLGVLGAELLGAFSVPADAPPSAEQLVDRVASLDPDPDLGSLLQSALHPDPAQRTPSVRAFADDLQAFLDDRPIRTARPGLLRRLALYCRRQRRVFRRGA